MKHAGIPASALVLTLLPGGSADAIITPPTITTVPIPAGTLINQGGGATLDNFVSQDLFANTTADWTTAAIVIELTAGSIYQDVFGNASGPALQSIIDIAPSVAFDTYVTSPRGSADIQGAAGDLGDFEFKGDETTGLSMSWDGGGTDKTDIGATRIGRFTLSDDAQGTWSLAVTEAHKPMAIFGFGSIQDGHMSPGSLPGDLNYDGYVGIKDLNIVLGDWNHDHLGILNPNADPSGDNFVGIEDLGVVLGNWNAGSPPPQTVPVVWPTGLVGDRTGDGFVGIADKVNHSWNQFTTPGNLDGGDYSGDGFVGLEDQNVLLSNWNNGTPPALVPEPVSLMLLISMGAVASLRRT